jgi:hypothetical protein
MQQDYQTNRDHKRQDNCVATVRLIHHRDEPVGPR